MTDSLMGGNSILPRRPKLTSALSLKDVNLKTGGCLNMLKANQNFSLLFAVPPSKGWVDFRFLVPCSLSKSEFSFYSFDEDIYFMTKFSVVFGPDPLGLGKKSHPSKALP